MTLDIVHKIRVFLSSPSDVLEERDIVMQVIDQLQYSPLLQGQVFLETVAWDKPGVETPFLATMTPQEAINQNLPKPSECDIVIVILWSRMGTPLPRDYLKPDGRRYWSGTEWEFWDAFSKAKTDIRPKLLVYRRNEKVLLDDEMPDFEERLLQKKRVREFFAGFVDKDGSITQAYNTYEKPTEFRDKITRHLQSIILSMLADESHVQKSAKVESKPLASWTRSPFPGLRPLDTDEADIFYGRDREIDDILSYLSNGSRFITIVGASGSGKSSLVRAGLLPRLARKAIPGSSDWAFLSIRLTEFDKNPFEALAAGILKATYWKKIEPIDYAIKKDKLVQTLMTIPTALADTCYAYLREERDWVDYLIFIDQFEELFTQVPDQYIEPFINMLHETAKRPRVRFITTLRADFYHHCLQWKPLAELLQNISYPLAPPDRIALHQMITGPALRAGISYEPRLPEQILRDANDQPGALPLIAYTLEELYKRGKGDKTLSRAEYDSLGGVRGSIAKRAEETYGRLSATAKSALPSVFRQLVKVDEMGTSSRRSAPSEVVTVDLATTELVEAFTEARLFVKDQSHTQNPIIEIAHEALLHNWPRLAEWIEVTHDDLRLLNSLKYAVREWIEKGKDSNYLWQHERLSPIYEMMNRLGINVARDLDRDESEFIRPEANRLLDALMRSDTDHLTRAKIGDRLAVIGDTRPGIGLDEQNVPEMLWSPVPTGNARITLSGDRRFAVNAAVKSVKSVLDKANISISKYPVTYQQFRAFLVADDGYWNMQWWSDLIYLDEPPQQNRPLFNHPADNISAYDAIAFCRWLSHRRGKTIRLPTETEWQLAAMGTNNDCQDYKYPWGENWHASKANTRESGLSRTIAVGMYPQGASPIGALDMSGNIFEWTTSQFRDGMPFDGAIDTRLVVRGGSWDYGQTSAAIDFREDFMPIRRLNDCGFRCVMEGA